MANNDSSSSAIGTELDLDQIISEIMDSVRTDNVPASPKPLSKVETNSTIKKLETDVVGNKPEEMEAIPPQKLPSPEVEEKQELKIQSSTTNSVIQQNVNVSPPQLSQPVQQINEIVEQPINEIVEQPILTEEKINVDPPIVQAELNTNDVSSQPKAQENPSQQCSSNETVVPKVESPIAIDVSQPTGRSRTTNVRSVPKNVVNANTNLNINENPVGSFDTTSTLRKALKITTVAMEAKKEIPIVIDLSMLFLGFTNIQTIKTNLCRAKPHVLNIAGCGLTNEALLEILSSHLLQKSVKVLNISDNVFDSEICSQLGIVLSKYSSLKELVMRNVNISNGLNVFFENFHSSSLIKLDISNIGMTSQHIPSFVKCFTKLNITFLNLFWNPKIEGQLESVFSIISKKKKYLRLNYLNFGGCGITDRVRTSFVSTLKNFHHVITLALSHSAITTEFANEILDCLSPHSVLDFRYTLVSQRHLATNYKNLIIYFSDNNILWPINDPMVDQNNEDKPDMKAGTNDVQSANAEKNETNEIEVESSEKDPIVQSNEKTEKDPIDQANEPIRSEATKCVTSV